MQKNEEFEGVVEGLGTDGEGIIKCEGTTAFVPFCLVGERVRFKALKVKDGIAYGKLEEVIEAASERVEPPCAVFKKCGGCALSHMNYQAQLDFKKSAVESALKKIGGIYAGVNATVPCESEYRYRNKLAIPVGVDERGETTLGFYSLRSHRIVPVDDCLIQSEWVKDVIAAVKKFAKERHIYGFDEQKRTGVLRRIVVREIKGKFIFALVATKKIDTAFLAEELSKRFENFTLLLNINSSPANALFGKEWHICRGLGFFEAEEGGIKYKAGANTFLQVNDDVRAKLYARVLDEAESGAVAVDLYSGGGMLTAMLAKKCLSAYGIEIVEEASRCADELKEANGLREKMFNICGAVEEKIDGVFKKTEGLTKVIVCDPPRKGMERSVVRAVANAGAEKIILISCNPATLARDLGLLVGTLKETDGNIEKAPDGAAGGNYEIKSITPFDMFPQTKHVETLVVLSKKQGDFYEQRTPN